LVTVVLREYLPQIAQKQFKPWWMIAFIPMNWASQGHIFPLKAKRGGVLRRAGHTEAAIDFSRLAGLQPAGVLVEIMNEDGTMARLDDLFKVREKFQLKLVSIKDLIAYRLKNESLITKEIGVDMPTVSGPSWTTSNLKMLSVRHNCKPSSVSLSRSTSK